MTLHVYGRTHYAQPLVEVGTAEDAEDVKERYRSDWVELVAFPDEVVHWIIRDGQEALDG